MESKQQLLNYVAKADNDRCRYLNDLFKYVPDAVVKEMIYTEIKKNECILSAGTPNDTVYILLSGQVYGVDHQKMGRVYYFLDYTKMYVVGDLETFGSFSEYCASIYATKDCKLLKISAKSYLRWIKHDENALFLRLNNIVSIMLRERMNDREYFFMNCKERLIKYLIMSYENENSENSGRYRVSKTQIELADRVGFNIRSVQRNVAALEKEQLISIENGKIYISQDQYIKLKQKQYAEE